ncbi:MAG: hypothetical protein PHZ19_02275 [Candidatus Thermoplasmatota archaeon]|nr:hypothetical protein [Candidatus Thermoplasmatota archaeon]
MKADKCPVCEGKGIVDKKFYPDIAGDPEAPDYVDCRSCNGAGIVTVAETKEEYAEMMALLDEEGLADMGADMEEQLKEDEPPSTEAPPKDQE